METKGVGSVSLQVSEPHYFNIILLPEKAKDKKQLGRIRIIVLKF